MKRHPEHRSVHDTHRLPPAAFTLVELLVVITIIGILAGLMLVGIGHVRTAVKNGAIKIEIEALNKALIQYKAKYGEYPPDFTDATLNGPVKRHLEKAFPRYDASQWQNDLTTAGMDVAKLTPQTALAFWLGGIPDLTGLRRGFAADQTKPLQTVTACASRTEPFFEFDVNRLNNGKYWPQGAVGDKKTGAIVYFRAENGVYKDGSDNDKYHEDGAGHQVFAAWDTRTSSWVNPTSFQIFSSGLDVMYGRLTQTPLQYPVGTGYAPETFDDITNFSGGTLEGDIP